MTTRGLRRARSWRPNGGNGGAIGPAGTRNRILRNSIGDDGRTATDFDDAFAAPVT